MHTHFTIARFAAIRAAGLALFFLAACSLNAQNSTIRGMVYDQQSDMPLVGATVQLLDVQPAIGATTDVSGAFMLKNVPTGRQAIRVSYLGYDAQSVPNVLVTAGKEVQLTIRLQESLSNLKEVVIQGNTDKDRPMNEMAAISARQFNTEEVMRYSGGRNDIAKLVANFAGVAANNDARNDIIIRGNSPTGVLWRLEGIPIPNPNHFSTLGTTGGPVSALNPNMIANSDFLTGAFPAEYGNALAGVFDINLRTGNKDRYEFMAQLGAFSGLEALVEGPLNKKNKGSFVLAYRHSFVELASEAGMNVGTSATPRYKDLTFNLDFGNTRAGRFSIFGIGGNSAIDFLAAEIDTNDLFANPNRDAFNTSRFGVVGLRHNILLGDRAYWRTVLSASYAGTTFTDFDLVGAEKTRFQLTDVNDGMAAYRLSSYYNRKINARLTLRTGFLLQSQQLDTRVTTRDNEPDYNNDGQPDWATLRDFNGGFNLAEVFSQAQYRLTAAITAHAGVRALYFDKTGETAAEPRAALNWKLNRRNSLNLGYGMHHQTQPLPVFFFRERQADGSTRETNSQLGFTRSQHLILGYALQPATDWRLKAETYYQWIDRVPVDRSSSSFSMLNTGADFIFPEKGSLVNQGTGRNYGLELTAEKFFSKGYYGLFTVSLFDAVYKGSDGKTRSTAFDGGYVVNFLAGREFKIGAAGRRVLTLDTKLTTAGGRPYTPVNLDASRLAGREILLDDQAFSLRLDPYFRWDFKLGFRLNSATRKLSQTFFLDFQNVTNRENIFAMRYNTTRGQVGRINQIGFFPDVLYRVEF